jgi:hypothetical protein
MFTQQRRKPLSKPQGYVIYEGPSFIDGGPIVMIGTNRSINRKTGNVIQTWILRQDVSPAEAAERELDWSICGNCIHRELKSCYVNLWHGPEGVWRCYQDGKYTQYSRGDFKGRVARIGSYGDPAAVPFRTLMDVIADVDGWIGYTHQWQDEDLDIQRLAWFLMASVESNTEYFKAQEWGWRTFRVLRGPEDPIYSGEDMCSNYVSGVQCIDCQRCNGLFPPRDSNIAIPVHGWRAKRFREQAS